MAEYKELINRCISNDRRSQNELYRELFSYLMNICVRYKLNYDDAGSALNLIFLKVLKGLKTFDDSKSFLPWVKTIAIRHLVDEYRMEKRHDTSDLTEAATSASDWQKDSALSKLNTDDILAMIRKLPTTTASVFNLHVIDGFKHREIAELLHISEGTSKWHLNHARKQLQLFLKVETKRSENIRIEL
ncbi:MAG: RNA polymerase sigma factor [Bacteroidia bacterium]|nr:RNA polymerase sigma factor [Bacteroidia bacterium]